MSVLSLSFLSTPSARRATSCSVFSRSASRNFYPRPPRGGRQYAMYKSECFYNISIHALREEGDIKHLQALSGVRISIHALREEGAALSGSRLPRSLQFLSTPSARRATYPAQICQPPKTNFYPRPPRGGRRLVPPFRWMPTTTPFLSTPSARRATAKTETKSLFSYKLYNILHEFRRALIYNGSKSYPNHAK